MAFDLHGDFSAPSFVGGEYVEMSKIEAKRQLAGKEKFLDDKKSGIRYASPMPRGTHEMNKNYASLHTGDLYQTPGKRECKAKLAAKEGWLDEKKAGIVYSNPGKLSSTPGDAYCSISGTNVEAFPPFGNYPKRGVREKVDVSELKEHRNIFTSPGKKGTGGLIAHPGVLIGGFPQHQDGDKYDAMKQKVAADAKAHKDAQALVDEKCRFVSTSKPPSKDDAKGFSATIAADADCLLKDPDPLTTCTPKERAEAIKATMPWQESGDRTWRHAADTKTWKFHTINPFPEAMPDKYDDHLIRESQTPMRRMGWHRHLKAGLVEGDIAERKPFKPSKNAKSIKTSSSIMFRNMRV
mmetsp:Transcript_46581/g.105270  ORF Transcript_46581/g.105270 Transcript_46581/m.105270 type:complete len:352 (+) Transcript_46581:154-1209(+)|eukprot:CAMPEP_0172584922 /NCGR_PEP_ID=MMETSP1068-20121228/4455_1 /TAXON_ID=35684 /ORGANISM="Pseudopedinella elastica, Strain CCMP716" /LENGTH=351 /DNA_ID=CAMNT_0013379239 /DNA_START=66 /DNA_END=1121 /DNA_ORIENTATION=-